MNSDLCEAAVKFVIERRRGLRSAEKAALASLEMQVDKYMEKQHGASGIRVPLDGSRRDRLKKQYK